MPVTDTDTVALRTFREALASPTSERIIGAIRASSSHWADPDTMRSFGCRVSSGMTGMLNGSPALYFVSSERSRYSSAVWNGRRRYTVRVFDGGGVDTIGTFGQYATRAAADRAARRAAADSLTA